MSRTLDALRRAEAERVTRAADGAAPRDFQVVTVASNKGGVGKTTLAANLAVYLRALNEDLPILLLGLDDQTTLERMFALDPDAGGDTLAAFPRTGSFASALRLGQYGVHFVPAARDLAELKRALRGVDELERALRRTGWQGLVVIDTKSDHEILTQSALFASDLALVVVKDRASLVEAERTFEILARLGRRGRVVLSLVDLRIKYADGEATDVLSLLLGEIRRRGLPLLETFLSRSPKVEALATNPRGRVLSVLHGARGSVVDGQLAHLAQDVLALLAAPAARAGVRPVTPDPAARALFGRAG
jgi:cellulose biosynthesis protein BcsQ